MKYQEIIFFKKYDNYKWYFVWNKIKHLEIIFFIKNKLNIKKIIFCIKLNIYK